MRLLQHEIGGDDRLRLLQHETAGDPRLTERETFTTRNRTDEIEIEIEIDGSMEGGMGVSGLERRGS